MLEQYGTARTTDASFHNNGAVVRWSMDWRFYGPDKPNNVATERPTDFSERHKAPLERAALACSFPSAEFVVLDRGDPTREVRKTPSLPRSWANFSLL